MSWHHRGLLSYELLASEIPRFSDTLLKQKCRFLLTLRYLNLWKKRSWLQSEFPLKNPYYILFAPLTSKYKIGETFPTCKWVKSILWFNYWIKYSKIVASLWPDKNYITYLTIHFLFFLQITIKIFFLLLVSSPLINTIFFPHPHH